MATYAQAHAQSIADPEAFWGAAAEAITWTTPPTVVCDDSAAPLYRWYPDARLNTCFNALDRHVESGRGDQPALIHVSPVTGTQRTFTYAELLDEVARFAGALSGLGVGAGDRVVLSMPMVPEAVIGMLACARLGAVHSVVFGGFAADELAVRIDDAQPKVILSASCGIETHRTVALQAAARRGAGPGHAPADGVRDPAAPGAGGRHGPARPRLGGAGIRRRRRSAAPTSRRPIRSTSSTPPARPAGRRGSCATTAGTPWRWRGRWPTSTTSAPATSGGRPPTWAGSWGTPTSSTRP